MRELVSGVVLDGHEEREGDKEFVVVRVVKGVRQHFYARKAEWVLAYIMVAWGINLALPFDVFASNPMYHGLAAMASENVWGYSIMCAGVVRLVALVLNGTFSGTIYAKYSPLVRSLAATTGAVFWLLILVGLVNAGMPSTGYPVYSGLVLLEFCCVWRATQEADRSLRNVVHL